MDKLPRLKISGLGWDAAGELRDFNEARYFAFTEDLIVTVEGQVVNSYEELEHVATSAAFRNKEYLEVVFLPVIVGG